MIACFPRALGLAFLLAAGCGAKPVACNDRVEGTVTLDGAPVAGVRVEFIPEGSRDARAPTSSAVTNDKGEFRLAYGNNKSGAALGKHRVVVIQGRGGAAGDDREGGDPGPAPNVALPRAYAIAAQTPLLLEVTGDKHTYEVPLTSAGR